MSKIRRYYEDKALYHVTCNTYGEAHYLVINRGQSFL